MPRLTADEIVSRVRERDGSWHMGDITGLVDALREAETEIDRLRSRLATEVGEAYREGWWRRQGTAVADIEHPAAEMSRLDKDWNSSQAKKRLEAENG